MSLPAHAQDRRNGARLNRVSTSISVIGGALSVTNGFDDRFFVSSFGRSRYANGLTVGAEATYADRDVGTGYFAADAGYWFTQNFRLRGGAAGSTHGDFRPRWTAHFAADLKTDPDTGIIFSPVFRHRAYRNGVEETVIDLQLVKYLPAPAEHVFVLQGNAVTTFISPGANVAPNFAATVTFGRPDRYLVSFTVEGGIAEYDSVIGRIPVSYPFIGVRGRLTYELGRGVAVIVGGEWSHNRFFNVAGGHLGLRYRF